MKQGQTRMQGAHGVTSLELVFIVAIAVILMSVAAPAIQSFVRNSASCSAGIAPGPTHVHA